MPYPFDAPRWQFCLALLHDLQQKQAAFPFLQPVDPVAWNIPNYASIILTPMDLSTVERKLNSSNPSIPDSNCENQRYSSTDEFITDVRLISRNCLLFNGADHPISDEARRLEALFDEKIRNLPVPVERRHSALQKLVIRIPPSGIKAKEMEATASNADSIVSLEEKIKILEMEIKEAKRLILHRRGARASESELTISTAITASTTVPSSFVWTTQADTTLLLQVHGSENNAAGFKAAADILGCSTPRACSCRYQKLRLQYSKELDKDTSDWVHLDILNKIVSTQFSWTTHADTTLLQQVDGAKSNAAGFKAAADILGCTPRACSCRYEKLRLQYSKELDKDTSDWVHLDILNKIVSTQFSWTTHADTTLLQQVDGAKSNAAGFKAAADILGCTPKACSSRYEKLQRRYSKELEKGTSDWVHLDICKRIRDLGLREAAEDPADAERHIQEMVKKLSQNKYGGAPPPNWTEETVSWFRKWDSAIGAP